MARPRRLRLPASDVSFAADLATASLRKALDAFARLDTQTALEVIKSDNEIDAEFDGVVKRLREGDSKRAFDILQEKVYKLGVAGLSSEEKQHYLQALGARGRSG